MNPTLLHSPSPGRELIDNSALTFFVPLATDFSLENFAKDARSNPDAAIEAVESRESLFFGTSTPQFPRNPFLTMLILDTR
jgi:hypothetical protein